MRNKNKSRNNTSAAGEIIRTPIFDKAKKRAQQYAEDPSSIVQVLGDVVNKAVNLKDKNVANRFAENLAVLVRMVRANITREYNYLPYKSLLRVLAGMFYFLFVADIIPDIIPFAGLLDDATVLAWVVSSLKIDIENFRNWENSRYEMEEQETEYANNAA